MPVNTGGVTINRFCSSGLQAIAMGADYIRASGGDCVVAGGVESISIPGGGMGGAGTVDPELLNIAPAIFMAMIDTADIVAKRYNISREYQDEYSCSPSSAWPRPRPATCSPTRSCRWRPR
jgi:acetyl-CoA C-acetyltransferase